jgi:amidohydrolase
MSFGKVFVMKSVALVLVIMVVPCVYGQDWDARIEKGAEAVESKVIEWRRDFHEHPELSGKEVRTAAKVADHLKSLGIEVQTGVAKTGVVGLLKGGKRGGVVALRADLDGLPVVEQTGLSFASKERDTYRGNDVGVMHACGHDCHVAILMGAAEVLSEMKNDIPGTIKFLFQPAEEGPGGADEMVEEGVLKNPDVDAIFGLHVFQSLEVGQISVRPGGMMAASDYFTLKIIGKQTHAAMPSKGVDPIVVAAQVIMGFQTIVSRQTDLTAAPAVITVGTINGGVRSNIIPDDVTLTGTVRTLDPEMQLDIHARMERTAREIAESAGASIEWEMRFGSPVTYNDPELTRIMQDSLAKADRDGMVEETRPVTGAEDFAFFAREVPAMFFFLGVRSPDVKIEDAIPNHSPFFDSDESALIDGVKAMSTVAVDFLTRDE